MAFKLVIKLLNSLCGGNDTIKWAWSDSQLNSSSSLSQEANTKHHGLQTYEIVLLRIGSIPKTSSSKIRRYACRCDFLRGTLNLVGSDAPVQIKQKQVQTICLTAGIKCQQDKIPA